jgi:hypothetical protein
MDSLESNQRRRGPRTNLSNPQLENRRDQLVQLFEGDWGRLGRELQECKKPDDLIPVFSPLLHSYAEEVFSVFCRPSDETATGATLRKIRRELRTLAEPRYAVEDSKRKAGQQLQKINWALTKAENSSRRIVQQERKKAGKEAWKAEQQSRTLVAKEKDLTERLRKLEASFARQEIFRFVKSERYELNPLSLANASANLPYSGWRQSVRRINGVPSKVRNGLRYRIFKAIRFLTASANKNSVNAIVTDFRARIRLLPSRHRLARKELAKNWYFLARAIRQGYKTGESPDALHFRITELYFKHLHSATDVETVVAEHEKIELSRRSTVPSGRRPKK